MRAQFILSEIGIGLRRNLSMAVSVVLVTFVSLSFVGAAALLPAALRYFNPPLFFLLVAWLLLNAYGLFRRPGGA